MTDAFRTKTRKLESVCFALCALYYYPYISPKLSTECNTHLREGYCVDTPRYSPCCHVLLGTFVSDNPALSRPVWAARTDASGTQGKSASSGESPPGTIAVFTYASHGNQFKMIYEVVYFAVVYEGTKKSGREVHRPPHQPTNFAQTG